MDSNGRVSTERVEDIAVGGCFDHEQEPAFRRRLVASHDDDEPTVQMKCRCRCKEDRTWTTSSYSRHLCHYSSMSVVGNVVFILMVVNCVMLVDGIEWLAVAKRRDALWNRTSECYQATTEGLLKPQRRHCARNLDLMPVVAHSARQMAQICQETFFDSRWNCSSVLLAPNFMPDLNGGSREQAFAYALASASLTQSISKACSAGITVKCSCGVLPREPPPPAPTPSSATADQEGGGDDVGERFQWGGCSDDIKFGLSFSQNFLDAGTQQQTKSGKRNTKNTKRMLMNQHNYRVGRKVTTDYLTKACKCHGVSGSCSVKTCWKSLADIRVVAGALLYRYSTAVEVAYRRQSTLKHSAVASESDGDGKGNRHGGKVLVPMPGILRKNFTDDDMIFYTMSPDYCLPDQSLGSVGTKDRECNKSDDAGSASCRSMCCGRGFTSQMVEVRYRCECKYYWCCYVKCKTCEQVVEVNRCK